MDDCDFGIGDCDFGIDDCKFGTDDYKFGTDDCKLRIDDYKFGTLECRFYTNRCIARTRSRRTASGVFLLKNYSTCPFSPYLYPMEVQSAVFKGSFPSEAQAPREGLPEYAFIGRSNVGKSSLINMLCGRKELAHTSGKPGKTQLLNFYLINEQWYIVDLPGYGYAQVSKKKRKDWERMIYGYLSKRVNLQCSFVLIDANIPPQASDLEMINWFGEMRLPFVICYTKTDRLKEEERRKNIEAIQTALLEHWNELPEQFITSANRSWGRAEILSFIEKVNKMPDE